MLLYNVTGASPQKKKSCSMATDLVFKLLKLTGAILLFAAVFKMKNKMIADVVTFHNYKILPYAAFMSSH